MILTAWRFITIMLTALTMGLAFRHLLEMPARLTWSVSLWVTPTVPGGLYWLFGTAFVDIGSGVAAGVLVFLVRMRTHSWP